MKKYQVQTYNNIAASGLAQFPTEDYEIESELTSPDAIILRSFDLHSVDIAESVKAIGRAGAGVNNIPIDTLTQRGVPVFNTPGANANAVKELVIGSLLLGCRNICQAWEYVKALSCDDEALKKEVEKGKKQYAGFELAGRTLGVIGLGAIGVNVANAAVGLGMDVIGYDPVISVEAAWRLNANVQKAKTLDQLLTQSDFVSIHVPLNDKTRHMIDLSRLHIMKPGAVLLNFSRDGVVNNKAIAQVLEEERLYAYINDFPNNQFKSHPRVISLPHLGASTQQSEENCASMVVRQIKNFLEQGTIVNSVNFPEVDMPWSEGFRLSIVNKNVPNMVGQISTILANDGLNVLDLINKHKDDIAYTLVDVDREISDDVVASLQTIDGIVNVRRLR